MDQEKMKRLCASGAMRWTDHVIMRIMQRGISREDVKLAISDGEIIEEYPDDYPYPSCLIAAQLPDGRPLHIVCGMGNNELWVVTAYIPDILKWDDGFKIRRGTGQ